MKKVFENKSYFLFLLPLCAALFPLIGAGFQPSKVFYMIMLQAGTLCTAVLLFQRMFGEAGSGALLFFGALLYMACPYRIYACYDPADPAQAVFWLLLPLYLWAVLGIVKNKRFIVSLAAASLSLTGMAYACLMPTLAVAGFTLLAALWLRSFHLLLPVGVGCVIALPRLLRLFSYLFGGEYGTSDIPVGSIMGNGYVLGEFFCIFMYRDGHPGMGPGLLLSLLAAVWLRFVKARKQERGECRFFGVLAVILLFMSLRCFPWEYVQRLGEWSLKLVSLYETPAVFFGLAQMCLCVPGAWAMGQIGELEDKSVSAVVRLMVIAACLGGVLC